ncbi:nicotinate-nucleotide--dimethylbenzimidazole phosphoribosyltransferase [Candidatus Sumerlaeota bacterium]|nr:nicotinate-nucleotide--dimethylbenzimidazole phosphoribosyltransferase [Candidatus Sumerlaeota bacterium]
MSQIEDTIRSIRPQDQSWRGKARARLEQLTMPYWALGRLMDLAEDLAGMTQSLRPPVARKAIVVMAGDHGVVAEGVSKYPQVVTQQMVHNFVGGGAGINALARQVGARVLVVDMGVAASLDELVSGGKIVSKRIAPGTRNIARGPAMSREQAIRSIEAGIEVVEEMGDSVDLLGTGDMGIGNTTPSSAIVAAITGCSAAEATGRGTGIGDEQLQHKISVVGQALRVNRSDGSDASDGLDVLAKVGGFEIGGIAGVILASASRRKPVLVDGFISTAGALIAKALAPASVEYMIAAHTSAEQGHRLSLQHLGKRPLLDLEMRLGEGTGAALAMNIVEAAVRILTDVKTFEEASVSKAER